MKISKGKFDKMLYFKLREDRDVKPWNVPLSSLFRTQDFKSRVCSFDIPRNTPEERLDRMLVDIVRAVRFVSGEKTPEAIVWIMLLFKFSVVKLPSPSNALLGRSVIRLLFKARDFKLFKPIKAPDWIVLS